MIEHTITITEQIPTKPGIVFDRLRTPAAWPDWFAGHHSFDRDPAAQLAVGERVAHRIGVLGLSTPLRWRCSTDNPPHRLELGGAGPNGIHLELAFTLSPRTAGTLVRAELRYGDGPLAGVAGESFRRHLQPMLEQTVKHLDPQHTNS